MRGGLLPEKERSQRAPLAHSTAEYHRLSSEPLPQTEKEAVLAVFGQPPGVGFSVDFAISEADHRARLHLPGAAKETS